MMTTWIKAAGAALVVALALYGGWQIASGARNLYADWQFLRAVRMQAIQQAQQRQARPAVTPDVRPQ